MPTTGRPTFALVLLGLASLCSPPEARCQVAVSPLATNAPAVIPATPAPAAPSEEDIATVLLGEEQLDDRLTHISRERDGRTTVRTMNGSLYRYLTRAGEQKPFGYMYFSIDPEFKHEGLTSARVELECLLPQTTICRLQYDASEGDMPKPYKSVLASGSPVSGAGGQVRFTILPKSDSWQTVTFHVTNAAFLNRQNGGADFRFEFGPPEVYVRRVSVIREKPALESAPAPPPSSNGPKAPDSKTH